jgi:DNA repair protein RecO (recombination protein O)
MALTTAEAILLDVRDLGERDRLATFLTRERGKLAGAARGARTKHSRFAGLLQPLAKVRMTWFEKEGRELVRIGDVELVRPAAKLQEDLEGNLLSSYLADHVLSFTQENEPGDLPYRLLDSVLEALLAGVDRDLAARYFEAWVLRLAGVYPAPWECPLCGRPLEGGAVVPDGAEGLVCYDCAGQEPAAVRGTAVGPGGLELLRRIGRESLKQVARDPPPPVVLREVETLNTRVRRDFLQGELKSYRVLKQTLG